MQQRQKGTDERSPRSSHPKEKVKREFVPTRKERDRKKLEVSDRNESPLPSTAMIDSRKGKDGGGNNMVPFAFEGRGDCERRAI